MAQQGYNYQYMDHSGYNSGYSIVLRHNDERKYGNMKDLTIRELHNEAQRLFGKLYGQFKKVKFVTDDGSEIELKNDDDIRIEFECLNDNDQPFKIRLIFAEKSTVEDKQRDLSMMDLLRIQNIDQPFWWKKHEIINSDYYNHLQNILIHWDLNKPICNHIIASFYETLNEENGDNIEKVQIFSVENLKLWQKHQNKLSYVMHIS